MEVYLAEYLSQYYFLVSLPLRKQQFSSNIHKNNYIYKQDSTAVSEASAHANPASTSGYHHPCLPHQQFCPLNCPEGYLTGSGGCQFCICYQSNVTGQFVKIKINIIEQTFHRNCSPALLQGEFTKFSENFRNDNYLFTSFKNLTDKTSPDYMNFPCRRVMS